MRGLLVVGLVAAPWCAFAQGAASDTARWWQRDLLDFSGEGASVVVNPLLDLQVGTGTSGRVFENNRGARFEAVIDGEWRVQGTLQERQGAADPRTSYWAYETADFAVGTVAMPGWGRAKWVDRTEYEPGSPLRFDVSRATTTVERRGERLDFRAGLDNVHEGGGIGSAFWSREAAPLPFVSLSHAASTWHASGWAGSAIGSDRGPVGATAEPLYARQRVSRLGLGLHREERWSTDVLWYRMARVPFGDEAHQARHWGGLQGSIRKGAFHAYAGLVLDWAACFERSTHPKWMGELVNVSWDRKQSTAWIEWHRARAGSARAVGLDGSTHLPLLHSATPIAHFWGDGVSTLAMGWTGKSSTFLPNWVGHVQAERTFMQSDGANATSRNTWSNPPLASLMISCERRLIPDWPISFVAGFQYVKWNMTSQWANLRFRNGTCFIALSHKFHATGRSSAPHNGIN